MRVGLREIGLLYKSGRANRIDRVADDMGADVATHGDRELAGLWWTG